MASEHERFWSHASFAFVGHSSERAFPRISFGELRRQGRKVFAVDPSVAEIDGARTYPDLGSLPEPVEAIVLELPPAETREWVGRAAAAGIQDVWIHQGTETPEAVAFARQQGMHVLTGSCAVMYVKQGFSFHALHRWVAKATGRY